MNDYEPTTSSSARTFRVTPRDLLMIAFRHWVAVILTFGIASLAVFAYVLLRTPTYEAQMTILVKRERVDPIVTAEDAPLQQISQAVNEEELNSEVELLRSRDLVEKVILATGLDRRPDTSLWSRLRWRAAPDAARGRQLAVAAAVVAFLDALTVQPLKKTTLIRVSYKADDPVLAARVLGTLTELYLDKHLAVHRPPGALDFFEQEVGRYRKVLDTQRAREAQYATSEGVVSVALEKEIAVRRVGDLETALERTQVQMAEAERRVRGLNEQIAGTPERITTEVREAQARLMEQQESTLLSLELKRIELLQSFQPTYPPVVEVEKQIAQTRSSIDAAKKSPIVEAVTNRDPTYDYLSIERAKARTELASLEASRIATQEALARLRQDARRLDQAEIVQQDIEREVKLAEQNYTSYVRKREETRISNALDVRRIVNVAVAEAPTVPTLPAGPRRLVILLVGLLLAGLATVALAFALDYFDTSFRTPEEVQDFLGSQVLAALPRTVR